MSKFRIGLAVVITVLWTAAFTVSFFDRTYHLPPEASGLMLAVVSWAFGTDIKKRIQGEKDEG